MRFVLRAIHANARADELATAMEAGGIHVVDVSPRMLLVEAKRSRLQQALTGQDGWQLLDERMSPLPDMRPKLALTSGK